MATRTVECRLPFLSFNSPDQAPVIANSGNSGSGPPHSTTPALRFSIRDRGGNPSANAIARQHIPQHSPWTRDSFNVASALDDTNAENIFSATAVLIHLIGPIAAPHATGLFSERTSSGAIYERALERNQTVSKLQDGDDPVIAASGSRKPAIQPSHASAACRKACNASTPPPPLRLAGNSRTPRRLSSPILLTWTRTLPASNEVSCQLQPSHWICRTRRWET